MGELTKEERESLVQQLEMHLHHLHVDSKDAAHSLKKCGVWNLLRDDYDRLVSEVQYLQSQVSSWLLDDGIDIPDLAVEVARLRARNEALEKVAKAAGEDHRHHTRPESDECDVCASLDALSALAEPGKGGAT